MTDVGRVAGRQIRSRKRAAGFSVQMVWKLSLIAPASTDGRWVPIRTRTETGCEGMQLQLPEGERPPHRLRRPFITFFEVLAHLLPYVARVD